MLRMACPIMRVILLFFLLFVPSFSFASTWGVEYLETSVVSSVGVATITVDIPASIRSHNYLVEYALSSLPDDNNYYNITNSIQCYPLGGGASSFSSSQIVFTNWLSSNYHTSSTGFGASPCNLSGTYYIVFRDTTASSSILYVAPYEYDVDTNIFGFSVPPLEVFTYDPDLTTRFTSLSITGTSTVTVTSSQYVNPSEVSTSTPTRNPTLVKYSISLNPSTTTSAYSVPLTPTTGTSTTSYNFSSLSDGTYDLLVSFSSLSCALSSLCPFPNIHIYSSFTISGGVLSATGSPEFYDAIRYSQDGVYTPHECGLSNIEGCVFNILTWVFVPPPDAIESLVSDLSSSSAPFLSVAYEGFSTMSDISDTNASSTKSTSTLAYTLTIPGTAISVEMFSVARMTALMGDSQSMFRLIAQMALWLGFIAMLVNTLNNMVALKEEARV